MKAVVRDIAIAIKDFCEVRMISAFTEDGQGELNEHPAERCIDWVDASDPENVRIVLDNRQAFLVKIEEINS